VLRQLESGAAYRQALAQVEAISARRLRVSAVELQARLVEKRQQLDAAVAFRNDPAVMVATREHLAAVDLRRSPRGGGVGVGVGGVGGGGGSGDGGASTAVFEDGDWASPRGAVSEDAPGARGASGTHRAGSREARVAAHLFGALAAPASPVGARRLQVLGAATEGALGDSTFLTSDVCCDVTKGSRAAAPGALGSGAQTPSRGGGGGRSRPGTGAGGMSRAARAKEARAVDEALARVREQIPGMVQQLRGANKAIGDWVQSGGTQVVQNQSTGVIEVRDRSAIAPNPALHLPRAAESALQANRVFSGVMALPRAPPGSASRAPSHAGAAAGETPRGGDKRFSSPRVGPWHARNRQNLDALQPAVRHAALLAGAVGRAQRFSRQLVNKFAYEEPKPSTLNPTARPLCYNLLHASPRPALPHPQCSDRGRRASPPRIQCDFNRMTVSAAASLHRRLSCATRSLRSSAHCPVRSSLWRSITGARPIWRCYSAM